VTLGYKVFRHSYLGFNSNSVLVYGDEDAVLIDASQLLSDSYRLVSQLIPMKKRITHIYVSHFHPDHHFGLEVLQFAFPRAKIVALPSVVKDMVFTSVDKLDMWGEDKRLGLDIPLKTTIPVPLREARLEVEGEEILFSDGWGGDCSNNSVAWIPSLKVLCATDLCFHDSHVWMAETDVQGRARWRRDLDRLREFDARVVIPAHCGEAQVDTLNRLATETSDGYGACLDWTAKYLAIYEDVFGSARTGAEFVEGIMKHYGDIKACDFCVHWEAQLLFPRSSPSWLTQLPGKPGEIFLNPDGGYDGDPAKE
jgi:glyoxylase-like metal-dependent hydrolase (beta-lactamase superfamily II)